MSAISKESKNKFLNDDFKKNIKNEPKGKKTQKRRKLDDEMGEVHNKEINMSKGYSEDSQICCEYKQKILNNISEQFDSRKQMNETYQKKVSELITNLEAEYTVLKNNVKELDEYTTSTMNCLHQTITAISQKIDALKELKLIHKNQCNTINETYQSEIYKFEEDLNNEVEKIKEKLTCKTKKDYSQMIQRSIIQAIKDTN